MRPAIHRDARDVGRRIEPGRPQRAAELVAYVALERLERGRQYVGVAQPVLRALVQPRVARHARHAQQNRLVRRTDRAVGADVDDGVEPHRAVIHAGRVDLVDAELVERAPVGQRHRGIDQRNFDQIMQRVLLRLAHLRADIRNHHVVAGHDAGAAAHAHHLAAARIGQLHPCRCVRAAYVARAYHHASQPNAHPLPLAVQLRIIQPGRHRIFHAGAGQRGRYQPAHQQADDAGVAVREMERVGAGAGITGRRVAHARRRTRSQPKTLEAREVERPHIER